MSNIKREFKDLAIYDPYEYLNSEITGDYDQAHANIHVEQCLLADQYKAVPPLGWLLPVHGQILYPSLSFGYYRRTRAGLKNVSLT